MGSKSTPDLNSDLEYERDQSNLDRARSDAEDGSVDVIEVSGTIKWFDVAKGFGFIVPDNGMADVLVHVTCLRRDGYKTAYEGARIVCEALDRPGGLQAFRILSMDETTAKHPSQMPAPRTHVVVEPTSRGIPIFLSTWKHCAALA